LVVFWLVSGVFVGMAAVGANPSGSDEDGFVGRVGDERSAAGLAGYAVAPDLVDVARRHAVEMQSEQRLFHNPSLASDVSGWDVVGENVGRGGSVEDLHQALMASPSHRENILSPRFTEIGVGVVVDEDDGELWVVQVFRTPTPPSSPSSSGGSVRAAGSGSSSRASRSGSGSASSDPASAPVTTTAPAAPLVRARVDGPVATTVAPVAEPALEVPVVTTTAPRVALTVASSAVATRTSVPADRDVSWPVAVAASMLVVVVGALAVHVGSGQARAMAPAGRRVSILDVWELAVAG
jgi:hypothetical protein